MTRDDELVLAWTDAGCAPERIIAAGVAGEHDRAPLRPRAAGVGRSAHPTRRGRMTDRAPSPAGAAAVSATPRLAASQSHPRLPAMVVQPVHAWRNAAGHLVPIAPGAAPDEDLTPIASGPLQLVLTPGRLERTGELARYSPPSWWRAWLASAAQAPAAHVGIFVGVGLGCTALLMAGGLL